MRAFLAKCFAVLTGICALAATGYWAYFIWSFDWGHFGSRSWGLGLMIFMFGAIAVFLTVGFAGMMIVMAIDRDAL